MYFEVLHFKIDTFTKEKHPNVECVLYKVSNADCVHYKACKKRTIYLARMKS